MSKVELTLVVSVFNEAEMLSLFWEETKKVLQNIGVPWEVIFVDDGSVDSSRNILDAILAEQYPVMVITLSRNFGHEAAMLAGIDHSQGNAVICLDADLQHPPVHIPEMLAQQHAGYKIVHMVRDSSVGLNWFHQVTSRLFYKILNVISPKDFLINASDFFLLDRRVCELLRHEYRERTRFLRGIIQTVGFNRRSVSFVAPCRAAGKSKYSFRQLCDLSVSALAGFSRLPLRLALLFGVVCGIFSVVVGIYTIIMKMLGSVISGYTTIVVLTSFVFSVQLFILGIIGEYLGLLFEEVKGRPIYIVESSVKARAHVTF